ncbi:hypothetical protein [Rugamonas aquatica]|uniref:DUF1311 domain-containing protein n=1 Tax=Rugamonas aquatica TaxID=2743357 RepID=A0A6A7N2N5_9BURK|nr:hypothetical protein [Rugamonas aquatica]MQA39265.1 hypothetical protein [Rugamonas aquatica]
MMKSLVAGVFLLSHFAANADDALLGCWRSQQVHVTLADQSFNDQNRDCVAEYDAQFVRSRCHAASGLTETLSAYQRIGADTLRVTPLDPVSREAKGAPSEVRYRIEDQWLLFDREFADAGAKAAAGKQPRSVKSVSMRVRPKGLAQAADCAPRGDSKLRIGNAPASSLAMTLPPGWQPLLLDPNTDQRLHPAVNTSLFIGAFVPAGTTVDQPGPAQMVLVLDDVRSGAIPVHVKEFAAIKKRFAAELGAAKLACDEADRVCAYLPENAGGAYTEMLNVNGRVAIVISSMVRPKGDARPALRESAQVFVQRLRADNAQ